MRGWVSNGLGTALKEAVVAYFKTVSHPVTGYKSDIYSLNQSVQKAVSA